MRIGLFRALWIAALVSNVGTWMQTVDAQWLAMDAVQKVGNGHPGTAMSAGPAAYLLSGA